jgi:hypothetical protein
MNGLQIFPNLVGVIGLSGVVVAVLRERNKAPISQPELKS